MPPHYGTALQDKSSRWLDPAGVRRLKGRQFFQRGRYGGNPRRRDCRFHSVAVLS
jgi:hypothetical protein